MMVLIAVVLAVLFYMYAGYPLWVALLARYFPRPVIKGSVDGCVSVVIAAYNEASRLPDKLDSIAGLQGAERIVEVLVVSDGSGDGTSEEVRRWAKAHPTVPVRLVEQEVRRGKPAALNRAAAMASGEILLFTDARQQLDQAALLALLANFADPKVGVVSGELMFTEDGTSGGAALGMGAYWAYEKWIRRSEAARSSVPGATGALYAMRAGLYEPIAEDIQIDDVAIPMQAVAKGARCVFEGAARIYDAPSRHTGQELVRKRRTLAGNLQLLTRYPQWLLPWRQPAWFALVSHKLLRLLSPYLLALLFVLSLIQASDSLLIAGLLAMQILFYLTAGLGGLIQSRGNRVPGGIALPMMFCSLQIAIVLGWKDFFFPPEQAGWTKAYAS